MPWRLASPGHQQPWYWPSSSGIFRPQHHKHQRIRMDTTYVILICIFFRVVTTIRVHHKNIIQLSKMLWQLYKHAILQRNKINSIETLLTLHRTTTWNSRILHKWYLAGSHACNKSSGMCVSPIIPLDTGSASLRTGEWQPNPTGLVHDYLHNWCRTWLWGNFLCNVFMCHIVV